MPYWRRIAPASGDAIHTRLDNHSPNEIQETLRRKDLLSSPFLITDNPLKTPAPRASLLRAHPFSYTSTKFRENHGLK